MIVTDFSVPPGTAREDVPLSDVIELREDGTGRARFVSVDEARGELADLYECWFDDDEIAVMVDQADRLDGWADESKRYGWSTHQVLANLDLANESRRMVARLEKEIVNGRE